MKFLNSDYVFSHPEDSEGEEQLILSKHLFLCSFSLLCPTTATAIPPTTLPSGVEKTLEGDEK